MSFPCHVCVCVCVCVSVGNLIRFILLLSSSQSRLSRTEVKNHELGLSKEYEWYSTVRTTIFRVEIFFFDSCTLTIFFVLFFYLLCACMIDERDAMEAVGPPQSLSSLK